MKKIQLLSILLISLLLLHHISHAMDQDNQQNNEQLTEQTVDTLSVNSEQHIVSQNRIRLSIQTIQSLIKDQRTIRLVGLSQMFPLAQINIAIKEMEERDQGSVPQHLKDELARALEEQEKMRAEQRRVRELQRQEQEMQQQQLQQMSQANTFEQNQNNEIVEFLKGQILQAISYDRTLQEIKTDLLCMGCYLESDINDALTAVGIDPQTILPPEVFEHQQSPVNKKPEEEEEIEIDEIENKVEQEKREQNRTNIIIRDEDITMNDKEITHEDDTIEEIEEETQLISHEIILLIEIIKAMKDPNYKMQLYLPIMNRLKYEEPKNFTLEKLIAYRFKKNDIIAACHKIGLDNIPENLKHALNL